MLTLLKFYKKAIQIWIVKFYLKSRLLTLNLIISFCYREQYLLVPQLKGESNSLVF